MSIISSGQLCQLRKAERGEELCLQALDERHSYCCQTGLAKFRPHKSLIAALSDSLRGMGAHVDIERHCADLTQISDTGVVREAWLVICAQFPGQPQLWRLDVTVRSTWAQPNASARPGAASDAGVAAKSARYGDTVSAIALEPLGRMAKSSSDTLWLLAQQARDMHITQRSPSQAYRALRLGIEKALLWSVAERLIHATGRGLQWSQRRPFYELASSLSEKSFYAHVYIMI